MKIVTYEPGKPPQVETLSQEECERIDRATDWLKSDAGRQYIVDRAHREEVKLARLSEAWNRL